MNAPNGHAESSMSVSIIRGATDKPVASETLAELIERRSDWSGKLFIGFPVIAAADGPAGLTLCSFRKSVA